MRRPLHARSHQSGGATPARQRCAIYTRKSSEEGLQQDFNSLDAQRDACEAYIRSQKQTGWVALPDMYDDGGISGGTMDRPALHRVLADIAAGRIDTVVVYKVDRLTRSLADFAKIVDAFDANGVSFVSVTQQFNTTTSMGRLTLNMLLSFAQFEREVTGERIRDKIAASKQRGIWLGGQPPLGYDVRDRKLVINPAEAELVRHMFQRYTVLKSVALLAHELAEAGVRSKRRTNADGTTSGGKPIGRGALYNMLQSRLYRGEIVHRDRVYPGQHAAIVGPELWDEVRATFDANRVNRAAGSSTTAPALLAGLAFDAAGSRLTPTHANKQGRRYRYYVSSSLVRGPRTDAPDQAVRVPAAGLEQLVEDRVCSLLRDEAALYPAAIPADADVRVCKRLLTDAAGLAARWPAVPPGEKRMLLQAIVVQVIVSAAAVDIEVNFGRLLDALQTGFSDLIGAGAVHGLITEPDPETPTIVLSVPAELIRTGQEMQLLIESPASDEQARDPDRSLVRLLAQARQFRDIVLAGQGRAMGELAAEAGVSASYFTSVFRLGFLSPEITQAILHGKQPATLTATRLKLISALDPSWSAQRCQVEVR